MILGVSAFIGLFIVFVGLVYSSSRANYFVNLSSNLNSTQEPFIEFVGYHNWTDFTNHCCCKKSITDLIQKEQWKCIRGNSYAYKARIEFMIGKN